LKAYTNAEIAQMQQRGIEVMRKYIHFSHTVTVALKTVQTRVQGLITSHRETLKPKDTASVRYS